MSITKSLGFRWDTAWRWYSNGYLVLDLIYRSYRYIWIDSLCIIQDSEEDWRREAVSMGEVYKNAICNIAATGAVRREDGCFLPRTEDPLVYTSLVIRATWKTSELMTASPGWYVGEVKGMWRREVLDAPLNHRAWVLQERLLSPRVLHFGARQILWECDILAACKIYPVEFTTQLRHLRQVQCSFYIPTPLWILPHLKTYGWIKTDIPTCIIIGRR